MARLPKSKKKRHNKGEHAGVWPLVIVEWQDSSQPVGTWQWADDYAEPEIVVCKSVGYLIGDTETAVALAPNLGDVTRDRIQASGIMRIPRKAVVRIDRLSRF